MIRCHIYNCFLLAISIDRIVALNVATKTRVLWVATFTLLKIKKIKGVTSQVLIGVYFRSMAWVPQCQVSIDKPYQVL